MRSEDGGIIHECLDGEAEAFGLLVDKYKEGIYAFVYGKLRDFHDAQDVTQEVFLQAYRDLRSLRRWESFVFWLYCIASTRCKLWIRSQSRRVDQEYIEDQDPRVVDNLSLDSYRDSQLSQSLREALDLLPEMHREVLMLHYFGGMNSKEIAKAIGASPGAIRMRLSRARAQLREEMVAMMDTAFEGQRIPAGFTLRIVEAVKRIKINPVPRVTALPWGLSLAAGIMIAAMTLGSQMVIHELPRRLVFSSETNVSEVREIPVDILGAPGTSIIAGNQGDTDGGGIDPRNPQNASLLAPAMGGGTWTQKADMPTARFIAGSAVVDGKIYVIGGNPVSHGGGLTAAVEEYDPATDTWTRRADMPTARQGLFTAAVDGIIYAFGGWDGDPVGGSTVEAYDPATDTWIKKADMPNERGMGSIAVVDGIIYLIGGQFGIGIGNITVTVEAYDPATDTWIRKADMPTARFYSAACVLNGRIYVSGGHTKWNLPDCVPTVEVYDPATDTWTQASDMPMANSGHSASVVNGKMYLVGGLDMAIIKLLQEGKLEDDEATGLVVTIHVYDPATDTWTTAADLPTPTDHHTAAVVDGKIYAIGGTFGPPPETIFSEVYEYDPGLPDNIAVTSPAGKLQTTWGEVKSE